MPNVFNVTAASSTVSLDARGHGEIAFTVSNASGGRLRGRAKAENRWFVVKKTGALLILIKLVVNFNSGVGLRSRRGSDGDGL